MRLTSSDNITIGVGLICVAFSFWLGSAVGALACFVIGGLVLIVNHLKQDGLSPGTGSDLGLNQPDGNLDDRRTPARGPFPPFPLGGSLKKADLFDYVGGHLEDHWFPVKNAIDVDIDWNEFKNTDLFADITLRGRNARAGILDIENNHVVVHTDALTAPVMRDWNTLSDEPRPEELLQLQFRIPRQVGIKRYRLVAGRPPGGGTSTYWLAGEIAFRRASLTNNTEEWFTPVEGGPLRGRSPGAIEAVLDWSTVKDPVNTVIADFGVSIFCTITGDRGRGRAILRDLDDNTTVETEWVEAAGRRMHGAWPAGANRKIALPKKAGVHHYVLEVEVEKLGIQARAYGTLKFGH